MKLLDVERKNALLSEFQKLQTLEEKLNFWSACLPVNYITYWEGGFENHQEIFNDLRLFRLEIQEHERKKFAKWVLDNYHDLSKKQNPYKSLLDLDQLKKAFDRKLEATENKLETVRKELMSIRKEMKQPLPYTGGGFEKNAHVYASYQNKFNASYSTFEDYREQGFSPDYQEVYSDIYSILRAENGFTVGRYWKYLKQLEKELEGSVNENVSILKHEIEELKKQIDAGNKRTLSKPAQMLLFYHLGLFDTIYKMDIQVKQKAQLIGAILNIGAENIEKNLSKLGRGSDYEKEKNYQELTDFLYDSRLNQLAKEIESKKKIK